MEVLSKTSVADPNNCQEGEGIDEDIAKEQPVIINVVLFKYFDS